MKLTEQILLWNNDGNSDKVYEVDLCEVGKDQYVVNFRYGRRGTTLKDGSKTPMPLNLVKAQEVFKKLVAEKTKGGYAQSSHYIASEGENVAVNVSEKTSISKDLSKKEYILEYLKNAVSPAPNQELLKKWSLARIVWRVGELGIQEAVPMLLPLLTKGDALQQYCVAWALGRCNAVDAISLLEKLQQGKATKDYVARVALTSLFALEKDSQKRKNLVETAFANLPKSLKTTIETNSETEVGKILGAELSGIGFEVLNSLYLASDELPFLRNLVLTFSKSIPFKPKGFKTLRHLFKIAEFREDAEMFALLVYRFENTKQYFNFGRWSREYGIYHNDQWLAKPLEEIKKADSKLAYSGSTRQHFIKRFWRSLLVLGETDQESYVEISKNILLSYDDAKDKGEPKETVVSSGHYNSTTRKYEYTTRTTNFDIYANKLTFNHILYQNSPRYELKIGNRAWRCKNNYKAGQPTPQEREEAFPTLWDKYPQALIELLQKSNAERVHEFAVKALKSRSDLKNLINLDLLVKILSKTYPITVKFGLDLVKDFYDAKNPNIDLLKILVQHPILEARQLAKEWIEAQEGYFIQNSFLAVSLIVNPYTDVAEWTRKLLSTNKLEVQKAEILVEKCIKELLAFNTENPLAETTTQIASETLANYFLAILKEISLSIALDLLKSHISNAQLLGAVILLNHKTPAEQLPAGIMASLIDSPTPQVRQIGVRLFGKLPEKTLLENYSVLSTFCISQYAEMRQAIQPTIAMLAAKHQDFGQRLLDELLPFMQNKEPYVGLHQDLFTLFENSLGAFLPNIPQETAIQMLHSGREITQKLGFTLIEKYINPENLSMRQIVRFASHETLAVRRHSWVIYDQNISRIKYEAEEALRILDAKWDDSRAFAFDYFRKNFTETDWNAQFLISIADSTRPDVQAFGRELLTKFFKQEDGAAYLLQLSQHPATNVQIFATNYLEQFAKGNQERIESLKSYFITLLSQVNKAGVAKIRVFNFLRKEAFENEKIAEMLSEIVTRQSVTMAVADKATCIGIMRDLRKKYPSLQMPLTLKIPAVKEF
jgi:predicted DNA-binding WGR domain protein